MDKNNCKYHQLNGGCLLTADEGFCELCIMEQYPFVKQCRYFEENNLKFCDNLS